MKDAEYKDMKIAIFEKAANNEITESQRDDLLVMLEEKKDAEDLSKDDINDFFDSLNDKYPDLADDIEKLQKKIEKADGDDSDDKSDDDADNKAEEDDNKSDDDAKDEKEVSEAALEIFSRICEL